MGLAVVSEQCFPFFLDIKATFKIKANLLIPKEAFISILTTFQIVFLNS